MVTSKGKSPFTVFAPTGEAFAKIPKADPDALLMDKGKLIAVLSYHVVPGQTSGCVTVDAAKVTTAVILAVNGVIHVIDTVLMPK